MSKSTVLNGNGKAIQIDNFRIQGHLLRWNDVVIPISNISMVSYSKVAAPRFPIWALLGGIISFWLFSVNFLLALLILGIAICVIIYWFGKYSTAISQMCLNILLNSGATFSLITENVAFAKAIVNVFSNIFKDGNESRTTYNINMQDCSIDNGAGVVQNFKGDTKE